MLRLLTIKIPANGFENLALDGDYIRIQSASVAFKFQTDNQDDFQLVEGEEAKLKGFQVIKVINMDGADQTLSLYVGKDAAVGSAKVSGSVTVSNEIALNAPTLAALETVDLGATTLAALETVSVENKVKIEHGGQVYGASYRSTTALSANTAQTVFSAASNVNGAIVHAASFSDYATGVLSSAFLAKTSAPANVTDGDAILSGENITFIGSSEYSSSASLKNPIFIPAGKGLYFISNINEIFASRSVLYTLL